MIQSFSALRSEPKDARRWTVYAGRSLKGAKPCRFAGRAIDQVRVVVINASTARMIGLAVPADPARYRRRGESNNSAFRTRAYAATAHGRFWHEAAEAKAASYVSFWGSSGSAWMDGLGCFRR